MISKKVADRKKEKIIFIIYEYIQQMIQISNF